MRVEGMDRLKRDMEAYKRFEMSNIDKTLKILSGPIYRYMMSRAPAQSGSLRKSIGSKRLLNRRNPLSIGFMVGVRSDIRLSSSTLRTITRRSSKADKLSSVRPFTYNPTIEFGTVKRKVKRGIITVKVDGTPFTRETYNAYKTQIVTKLKIQLESLRQRFKKAL